MRKTLLPILSAFLVFVVVALLGFYINSQKPSSSRQTEPMAEPTSRPSTSIVLSAKITMDPQTKSYQIEVSIKPITTETVAISAFALKTILNTKGGFILNHSANESIFVNPSLKQDGWSFPISQVVQNKDGSIELGLSGYRLGNNPFNLEKEIVLASIPISAIKTPEDVEVIIDSTYTKFLGLSATEEIILTTE